MTSLQIIIAEWVVRHRERLRSTGIGIVALIALGFLLNGFVGLIVYASIDRNAAYTLELSARQPLIVPQAFHVVQPLPLTQESTRITNRTSTGADLVGIIANPNTAWKAIVGVGLSDDASAVVNQGIVLPGRKRYVIVHVPSDRLGQQLVMASTQWQRVDRHQFPDIEAALTSGRVITVAQPMVHIDSSSTTATFSLTNTTPYRWRQLEWVALAQTAGQILGARSIMAQDMEPGDVRPIIAGWEQSFPQGTQFQLILQSDVLSDELIAIPAGDKQEF